MKAEASLYRLTQRGDGPWTPIYLVRSFVPGDGWADNFWAGFEVRFAWGRCGGPLIRGSDDPNETVLGRGLPCQGSRTDGIPTTLLGSVPIGYQTSHVLLDGHHLDTDSCSRPCLLNRSATALHCGCRHAPAPITISSGYTLACSTPLILICPSKCSGDPPAER